jgi:hypothetical protein
MDMKWNCGPTPEEAHAAKEIWHAWFAWRPVRVGSGDCRLFETIQRKGTYWTDAGWTWEYKA